MNEDRRIGQRAGIRWAIAWLHKQANGMTEDPSAQSHLRRVAALMAFDAIALRNEDADDISAGIEALKEPVVATWPEVKTRLDLKEEK